MVGSVLAGEVLARFKVRKEYMCLQAGQDG